MIEEIPINSDVNEVNPINSEINSEPVAPMVEEAVEAEPEEPAPAPKKRGRPFGAKAKAKPKAKVEAKAPKVETKKKQQRVVEESESEEEVVVKKRTRRPEAPEARIPTTQDVAFEVMQLLSNRHVDQAAQRRAKYASWFQ